MSLVPPIALDTAPPEPNAEGSDPTWKCRMAANQFNDAADDGLWFDHNGKPFVCHSLPNRETES